MIVRPKGEKAMTKEMDEEKHEIYLRAVSQGEMAKKFVTIQ
jgi:hypothetical protein